MTVLGLPTACEGEITQDWTAKPFWYTKVDASIDIITIVTFVEARCCDLLSV